MAFSSFILRRHLLRLLQQLVNLLVLILADQSSHRCETAPVCATLLYLPPAHAPILTCRGSPDMGPNELAFARKRLRASGAVCKRGSQWPSECVVPSGLVSVPSQDPRNGIKKCPTSNASTQKTSLRARPLWQVVEEFVDDCCSENLAAWR